MAEEIIQVPAISDRVVRLPVPVDDLVAQWQEYQELCKRLLMPDDYYEVDGKTVKKKSAFRKFAKVYNVTTEIVEQEIVRDEDGFPRYVSCKVRATAPNGRSEEGVHECHVTERCCPAARGENCWKKNGHRHCDAQCSGRRHWAHAGDIVATAHTRAKNRAISDLVAAGEISAEEIDANTSTNEPVAETLVFQLIGGSEAIPRDYKQKKEQYNAQGYRCRKSESGQWQWGKLVAPDKPAVPPGAPGPPAASRPPAASAPPANGAPEEAQRYFRDFNFTHEEATNLLLQRYNKRTVAQLDPAELKDLLGWFANEEQMVFER